MSSLCITGIVNGAEMSPVAKPSEEEQFAQIQDALKVLPPIKQYLEKMGDVSIRYEKVFEPLRETETEKRIQNAKEKAIKFYAEIFGVNLSEIEKYDENVKNKETETHNKNIENKEIAKYLAWVAKKTIENGKYEFARNEEELFDGGLEQEPDIDFSQKSSSKYPEPNMVPKVYQIYARPNDPYFESLIIHETGHVLEYAYRILLGIKNATRNFENYHMCEDAVSVFFETLYNRNNDFTFCLIRLSDFYGLKFEQEFIESIKNLGASEKKDNPKLYERIESLSKEVHGYRPMERENDHKNTALSEEDRTKNDSEEDYKGYIFKKYPELQFVYDRWEKQAEKWGTTTLPTSNRISDINSVSWRLCCFLKVFLGKSSEYLYETRKDAISAYTGYVPHVYRTLKLSDTLKTAEDVVQALGTIVCNVPKMMTKDELEDFIKLLGLK